MDDHTRGKWNGVPSLERGRNDEVNDQSVSVVEIVTGSVDLAVFLRLFSFVCFPLLRGYDYYPFLSYFSSRRMRLTLYASLPLCPFPSHPPHPSLSPPHSTPFVFLSLSPFLPKLTPHLVS